MDDLAALLAQLPLSLDDEHGAGAVLRTGVPEWLPGTTPPVLDTVGACLLGRAQGYAVRLRFVNDAL